MLLHKIKLFLLRNGMSFIYLLRDVVMIATLIVVVVGLSQNYKQQEQTEQLLKGLSCILLILPEDRTNDNVSECIEINSDTDLDNFIFKNLRDDSNLKEETSLLNNEEIKTINLLKEELRGEPGLSGRDGVDGQDGEDGEDGENAVSQKTVIKEQVTVKGEKGDKGEPGAPAKEVEFRYNETHDRIEWRHTGDRGWQLLVNGCSLTNTCEDGL